MYTQTAEEGALAQATLAQAAKDFGGTFTCLQGTNRQGQGEKPGSQPSLD